MQRKISQRVLKGREKLPGVLLSHLEEHHHKRWYRIRCHSKENWSSWLRFWSKYDIPVWTNWSLASSRRLLRASFVAKNSILQCSEQLLIRLALLRFATSDFSGRLASIYSSKNSQEQGRQLFKVHSSFRYQKEWLDDTTRKGSSTPLGAYL